jgi:type III restriction enzyme
MLQEAKKQEPLQQLHIFSLTNEAAREENITDDIDTSRIIQDGAETANDSISEIERSAIQQNEEFEKTVTEMEADHLTHLPNEIQSLVKVYPIKDVFVQQAESIHLPQFYLKIPANDIFGNTEQELLLEKENLLEGFKLSQQSTDINFDDVSSELYKIDLDETKKDHVPTFIRLDKNVSESMMTYMLNPARKGSRIKNFTKRIMDLIGNMYPIPDKEIEKYLNHVLENFTDEQFGDFYNKEYSYKEKIKQKIESLSEAFAEKKFKDFLDTDKVYIKPSFELPKNITPGETSKSIAKSLYEKEGSMNTFEERVINEIGNMNNISFWTRNLERKGFKINGFINHYPDFIIQTKSGKTVLLETKGDHLDAEQKIRLGNLWAGKAGNNFRYFMVYEKRNVEGAYRLEDFLNLMREI